MKGVAIGYFGGDPLQLFDDLQTLKPTIFLAVPRIINRVYGKVMAQAASFTGTKKWLFDKAIQTKVENYKNKCSTTHYLYDSVVFKKIRNMFGGNVKFVLVGAAPISPEVLTFFKIALGVNIREAYGSTELGLVCCTRADDPVYGNVGGISPCIKARLRDIPEAGYLSTDPIPRGEL